MQFECENPNGIGIYKIENIKNGKFYIGCTINFKKRYRQHYYHLLKNNHPDISKDEISKYGIDNFKFSVIEEIKYIESFDNISEYNESLSYLRILESYYIKKYDPAYNKDKSIIESIVVSRKMIKSINLNIFKIRDKQNCLPSGYVNFIHSDNGNIKKIV
jgi:group I intron endonuclease